MRKTNLEMMRGDTLSFGIEIEFDESPQQLEKAFFTVKENKDDDPIFQKSIGNGISYSKTEGNKLYYILRVEPTDTKDVDAGKYYYDLQIELNHDVFTVLYGALDIYDDVTK